MPNTREKLVELVGQVQDCGCDVTDVVEMNYVENNVLIDHLIANGVTIPVRCKDCIYRHCSEFCECRPENFFCEEGERKDNDLP